MSFESWLKEFYPVVAGSVDEKQAGAHAELKWSGALKKNLKKHKVSVIEGAVVDDADCEYLNFDSDSCAWCVLARRRRVDPMANPCDQCPAVLAGMHPCWGSVGGQEDYPYNDWTYDDDARPMLTWIRRARKKIEKKKNKEANNDNASI